MEWKIHRGAPVRTSKARTWPGGMSGRIGQPWIDEPTMTRSPTTSGGEVTVYH